MRPYAIVCTRHVGYAEVHKTYAKPTKVKWARHTRFLLPLLPSGPGGVHSALSTDPYVGR